MSPVEIFVFGCINFLILAFFLILIFKRQILSLFGSRQKIIGQAIQDAQKKHALAKAAYSQAKTKFSQVDEEASHLRRSLVESGGYAYDALLEEARKTAARVRRESEAMLLQEEGKAKVAAKNEILELAFNRALQNLKQQLPEDKQAQVLEESLLHLKRLEQ